MWTRRTDRFNEPITGRYKNNQPTSRNGNHQYPDMPLLLSNVYHSFRLTCVGVTLVQLQCHSYFGVDGSCFQDGEKLLCTEDEEEEDSVGHFYAIGAFVILLLLLSFLGGCDCLPCRARSSNYAHLIIADDEEEEQDDKTTPLLAPKVHHKV